MDIAGEDIICLALRAWDSPWKNNQQVMSRLARMNRVLYVGPPRWMRESVAAWQLRVPPAPVLEAKENALFLYQEPRLLARTRHSFAYNWLAGQMRLAQVRRLASSRLRFSRPILWVYDPMHAGAVGTFGERIVVYSVIDNYREYYPVSQPRLREAIDRNHRRMLRAADVVFTVSESLRVECHAHNPHCYYVPNGVPFERFQEALSSGAVPADVAGIPRPIVGYVGVIQSTIDLDLLQAIALRRPDWSVLIVGPVEHAAYEGALEALRATPNVHILGGKETGQVPHYMKVCDVAVLPYRRNQATMHIDSIKLYEYLACGKPVVATDIPSARRFPQFVSIADGAEEFIRAIEEALVHSDRDERERMAFASEQNWDRRVREMGAILSQHMMRPRSTQPQDLSVEH